jgi:hypothetical protein
MGNELTVEGMPFMQQDTSVGACAQASLWMVTRYMHEKFKTPKVLPYELTDYATRSISLGSIMPNRKGLKDIQMLEALRTINFQCVFEPIPAQLPTPERALFAKKLIYPYLESELPVILLMTHPNMAIGHAVVAIGHTFARNNMPIPFIERTTFGDIKYLSNISWIPKLIIHNDSRSPYEFIEDISNDWSLNAVASIIAILPREVTLFAAEAESNVITSVQTLINKGAIDLKTEDLVFRTYLRPSNTFKYEASKSADMPKELMDYYRRLPMPKYIWVTEISNSSYLNNSAAADRKRFGEFLADSTANPLERAEGSCLAMRINDILFLKNSNTGKTDLIGLESSSPYTHLIRK